MTGSIHPGPVGRHHAGPDGVVVIVRGGARMADPTAVDAGGERRLRRAGSMDFPTPPDAPRGATT